MKRRALVFGADHRDLKYALSDAEKVSKALAVHGYEVNDLKVFDTVEAKDVPSLVYDSIKDLGKKDTLLFYFAGHGVVERKLFYLILESSKLGELDSYLDMTAVMSKIRACKAGNKIVMLDTCHSGAVDNVEFPEEKNFVTIVAAQAYEVVKEQRRFDGGFLSYHFEQALSGKALNALNHSAELTNGTLMDWLTKKVKQEKEQFVYQNGKVSSIILASFEGLEAQTIEVVKRIENVGQQLQESRQIFEGKTGQELAVKRLKSKHEFLNQLYDDLETKLSIIRNDFRLEMDNVRKHQFNKRIQAMEAESIDLETRIEDINQKLKELK